MPVVKCEDCERAIGHGDEEELNLCRRCKAKRAEKKTTDGTNESEPQG